MTSHYQRMISFPCKTCDAGVGGVCVDPDDPSAPLVIEVGKIRDPACHGARFELAMATDASILTCPEVGRP